MDVYIAKKVLRYIIYTTCGDKDKDSSKATSNPTSGATTRIKASFPINRDRIQINSPISGPTRAINPLIKINPTNGAAIKE